MKSTERVIGIVGLGYVGLPLACALSKKYTVIGFDKNKTRITELQSGLDRTREVEKLADYTVTYSDSSDVLSQTNFIIVAVPTPIMKDNRPDLRLLEKASVMVGEHLKRGTIVVYESTVYPGCTEEVCVPILEHESGLKCGVDFFVGYSPERANPGDKTHTVETITKVVAGMDAKTLDAVAEVYGAITKVYRATSIKVAEAAKVIENVQRDLNIALMNELAIIFDRVGIDTKDVIAAAASKWNFHAYFPGLVGGHCIGVDPYYLTYKAERLGYRPKVILAGRKVNESMPGLVVKKVFGAKRVLIMGVTFKENVPDVRNSKVEKVVSLLKEAGSEVVFYDPYVERNPVFGEKIENWPPLEPVDAVIVASPHTVFSEISLADLRSVCRGDTPVLFDVRGMYARADAQQRGFQYFTL